MLRVSNVAFSVRNTVLLKNIHITVEQGEFLAICGPNGAGKSSLIRLLSGEMQPTEGSIAWQNKPLSQWSALELACQRALLQQHCEVGFNYSAIEVVLLGRYPHHFGNVGIQDIRIAEAALIEVEAHHLAKRLYATLSGGEQARVHMARVLAQIWESQQPSLLLLDEPTAALDPRQQHRLLEIAKQWSTQHKTTIVAIVHDLNLAAQYADRIALLRGGRIQLVDSVDIVMQPEHISSCFDIDCVMVAHPDGGIPLMSIKRQLA